VAAMDRVAHRHDNYDGNQATDSPPQVLGIFSTLVHSLRSSLAFEPSMERS